jgi:CDP-6-deoxy-D-xylo-4-hexulose-3-dehydrase
MTLDIKDSHLKDFLNRLETKITDIKSPTVFLPGVSSVPVSGKKYNVDEILGIFEAALDGWWTSGRFTQAFEKGLSEFVGTRAALFVNSGSSANLLALSALLSPKLGKNSLKPGDEVITMAMGFPTTINPIIQNGLKPVLIDLNLATYDANIEELRSSITPRTKAIMMAHTLGNPFDVETVVKLCEENDLWLIEDNCDALGSEVNGKKTGSFGDLATLSFYPAHHITTGEGGAVLIKSALVKRQVESFRDWGRDCYCETGQDNTCQKRFEWQLGDLPHGYDHKYIYSHIGYNLKATDLQAAIGVAQLNKLEYFIRRRRENFEYLLSGLSKCEELIMPKESQNSKTSWFGFPITIKPESKKRRNEVINFMENRKIGTRLLFGGNLTKQPAYKNIDFKINSNLKNSDIVMKNAFWVGVHPSLNRKMLDFVIESFYDFFKV